ncbi:MAG: YVTN family beta-propeller repeat protein [Planctomycetota bacterium]|jgi:YVTN family beta-propeller protein
MGRLLPLLMVLACAAPLESVSRGPSEFGAGTLIVLNKSGASASLIDAMTGVRLHDVPTGAFPHEVAVSPDGETAVVSNYGGPQPGGNSLTVIDVPEGRAVRTIDLGENRRPHGIEYLPDGRRVVVTTEGSGRIAIVNVVTGRVVRAIETGQNVSHMVVLDTGRGNAWVSNIGSGSVCVIDLDRGTVAATIPTGAGAEGLDLSPDGRVVWVGNRGDDTLTVLDAETFEVLAELPCAGFPIRVKFTRDGKRVLVSNARSGEVAVFDAATRAEVARIPMELTALEAKDGRLFGEQFAGSPVPVGLLVSADGQRAWVANTNADIVTVLDLARLEVAGRIKAGAEPDGLGWSALKPARR